MNVVFRKTEGGHFVVLPFGHLSPIGFVTQSESEFSRAKTRYNSFSAIVAVAGTFYYGQQLRTEEDISIFLWVGIVVALVAVYGVVATAFSKVTRYRKSEHGQLI